MVTRALRPSILESKETGSSGPEPVDTVWSLSAQQLSVNWMLLAWPDRGVALRMVIARILLGSDGAILTIDDCVEEAAREITRSGR